METCASKRGKKWWAPLAKEAGASEEGGKLRRPSQPTWQGHVRAGPVGPRVLGLLWACLLGVIAFSLLTPPFYYITPFASFLCFLIRFFLDFTSLLDLSLFNAKYLKHRKYQRNIEIK